MVVMETELQSLLCEYARLEESERATFFSTLANNTYLQAAIYRGIEVDESQLDSDLIADLLHMLLAWYREDPESNKRHVYQYLPQFIGHCLCMTRLSQRRKVSKDIEGFLLTLFNSEILDASGQPKELACQVPSLTRRSVYHDGIHLDINGLEQSDRISAYGCPCKSIKFKQITSMNAQNRMIIVEALFMALNSILAELSKNALSHFISAVQHILQRGYSNGEAKKSRINLSPDVLLEIIYAMYFCIYNGFQSIGTDVLEIIKQRGEAIGSATVLLTLNSVRTVSINSGPSHLPEAPMRSPDRVAKHLITNASFRAKKIGDDIPKVESEQSTPHPNPRDINPAIANNLKALSQMPTVNDKVLEDMISGSEMVHVGPESEHSPSKLHKDFAFPKLSKDKQIKAKILGFKKKSSDASEKDGNDEKGDTANGSNITKKKIGLKRGESNAAGSSFGSEFIEMTKLMVKGDKKKEKPMLSQKNSGMSSSSKEGSSSSLVTMHANNQHQQQQQHHLLTPPSLHANGIRSNPNSDIHMVDHLDRGIQMTSSSVDIENS